MQAESAAAAAPCTRCPGEGTRKGTGVTRTRLSCSHTKRHFQLHWDSLGEAEESCLQNHGPCLTWMSFQGDRQLPARIPGCQKHTEGVTAVAALQLERSPGWLPAPAFSCGSWSITGDASQDDALHNHELQEHLPTHCPPSEGAE